MVPVMADPDEEATNMAIAQLLQQDADEVCTGPQAPTLSCCYRATPSPVSHSTAASDARGWITVGWGR